ncbi:MAG: DUF2955 domain-containing protein [Gammaproteobacteria bacterium]|nr:DUF2955 domain-containing protein [Gammaproteobacteria bacterium]
MSTRSLARLLSPGGWLGEIADDPVNVRIVRFALGVTIAVALAYGIEWPLSFLFPVLTALILSLPLPMPTLAAGLHNMLYSLSAFGVGLVFSLFFINYPMAYILMLGFVLFHLYYYLNRGGSFWLTLMSILSILMLPMLANTAEGLATGLALGFIGTSWLTVVMVWIAHLLVPDPGGARLPARSGFQPGYSAVAAKLALKSTVVILPLASLFIIFDLMDYLLVMIFSAIFILKPELSKGKEAGKNSLVSTILGGVCAWVFYWLIVAVPEYHFYIVLMLFTTLVFGMNIFSAKPMAKYYGSALVVLLVLVNGSMGADADFATLFVQRIILIVLAVAYITAVLKILDNYWPPKQQAGNAG